ncbi:MAG: family 10 glycosylhydrolase [Clostridia bacterium]|nr:family 10 glycosylhydrolase [Clostridia bacterium]
MKNTVLRLMSLLIPTVILVLYIIIFPCNETPENRNVDNAESRNSAQKDDSKQENTSDRSNDKNNENMIAVWVPYMSLDMEGTDRSENAYRNKINEIFNNISELGADAVIFQVRPFCDALYNSGLFPSSHIISGTQGTEISYDPLKIATEEAHKRNLQLHAWVNPLRVRTKDTPSYLSEKNPVSVWKNDDIKDNDRYYLESGGGIYLSPAYPEVRKLIINGVREIVKNYDIDGIQIDDYFYPADDNKCDKNDYDDYVRTTQGQPLSLNEWRMQNINELVRGLYHCVHSEKKECIFGISPQCNTENDLKIGADIYSWSSVSGYADYICPQVYVSESHPVLTFQESVTEWRDMIKNDHVKLYIGLAVYKVGTDADSGTWLLKDDNIRSQAELANQLGADGIMLYSYDQLFTEKAEKDVRSAVKVFKELTDQPSQKVNS